jgi:hypothetical protein
MTIAEAFEKIRKAFGMQTSQRRAEDLAGPFSKNKRREDLFLPVFQVVLNL